MKKILTIFFLSILIYTSFIMYKESIKADYHMNFYLFEENEQNTFKIALEENGVFEYHEVNTLSDDIIYDAFDYLASKNNQAPINTISYLPLSTELMSYKMNDNVLTLNLSSEFNHLKPSNTYKALKEIILTYRSLGFHNVFLAVDGERIEELNSWNLEKGLSNIYLIA